ncbi:MAG TPA: deoxyribodipyrimidine photo-lyase [Solirubrobacteraceae bacterium]|nr:deoxyribodipyrimidine photo-lyase [Solirubrobacteraceae bacterium]
MSTCLLWYRRDLRVHDHPALHAAGRAYERVVPVFVLDDVLLSGRFSSASRTGFMLGCLAALDGELARRGSGLVIRHGAPERVLPELAAQVGADAVLWTSDVAPYARGRDRRVTEALRTAGVRAEPHGGNYIIDISKPRTQSGDPYHVFSPFFRGWQAVERRPVHRAPAQLPALPAHLAKGSLPRTPADLGVQGQGVPDPVTEPGEAAARRALERWLSDGIAAYGDRQDGMARVGTSQLSPYLRWGCLSPREAEERAARRGEAGPRAWIRQLGWRDFYAHVLLMWPGNARHEFQERMRGLDWDPPEQHLEAWQQGETGYPLVDAGMRQLAGTGWMHNRVRLVVGSFLTKDLHVDWREGERWFERWLLDGEPAQNNGNWQWIASVGTDPAPVYRRLYNPALQGQRLDPDGEYVRHFVPELRDVPAKKLYEPWRMSESEQREAGCRIGRDYPGPVVDHKLERERALERYARRR